MIDPARLPYRANVGAALFAASGRIFVGRRADRPHPAAAPAAAPGAGQAQEEAPWQLPQGGIDEGEEPRDAVLRELREEIGTDRAEIIGEHPDWLTYDFPPELVGRVMGGRYRGQRQKWFALRFLGTEADIRLDLDAHPEFDAWRWVDLADLPGLAVAFKRPVYQTLAASFARFAAPS